MAEKTNTVNREKIFKIIALSLFAVGILLMFIGCFGDIAKAVATVSGSGITQTDTQTLSFTWLFKDMWDMVKTCKGHSIYGITLLFSLFSIITYILCVGGVVLVAALTLTSFLKDTKSLEIKVNKYIKYLAVAVLPFVAVTMMFRFGGLNASRTIEGTTISISEDVGLGWGTVLLIVGFIIALVASALDEVKANMTKNDVVYLVLNKTPLILIAFVVIFGFRSVVAVKNVDIYMVEIVARGEEYYGIYFIFSAFLTSARKNDGGTLTLIVFALMFLLIMVSSVVYAYKENKAKKKIGLFATSLVMSIMAGVFLQVAINNIIIPEAKATGVEGGFGSAFILDIVMFAIALVLTCVSTKFAPVEKITLKKTEEKSN